MTVYTFRVSLEDDDNIYRDIEITAIQNFGEFCAGMLRAFDKSPEMTCVFFECGKDWNKGKAIKKGSDTKLKSLVNDPNQMWICEPENSMFGNILIELRNMDGNFDEQESYPRVIKKNGLLPGVLIDADDEAFSAQVVLEDEEIESDGFEDYDDPEENF
jgi:hypothetical protein